MTNLPLHRSSLPSRIFMHRFFLSFAFVIVTQVHVFADDSAVPTGPWDIAKLQREVPSMKWIRQDSPVHGLVYEGEVFKSHAPDVFAFYASPATLGHDVAGKKFPGVVLIHGGGGTAFAEWAHLWAKRGYAAIAMDLSGMQPPHPEFDAQTGAPIGHQVDSTLRTRLERGGPMQGNPQKFDSIGGDVSDDWPMHAVANVIRAHTLLRSFPEVDAERTAVTGISWGGYTTCLVASLDERFKAAVPVYGCGFLHEGESVQKPSIDALGERRDEWVRQYDPSSWLNRCRVPILFVNGTNDPHYCLDSYMKSYHLVPGEKNLCITVNMPHSHVDGWAPHEIGLFIDSKCVHEMPLPRLGKPEVTGDTVSLKFESQTGLKSAELHYTTDQGLRSDRRWENRVATIADHTITAPRPPADATTWFITVSDERGAVVSTEVQFSAGDE